MRAIRVSTLGGADALEWADVPTPVPGPGQVLVRLAAIGVNFIDVYHRRGVYKMPLPYTPGGEGAGVVEAVGAGVSTLAEGDRVASAEMSGAYAEFALAEAAKLVHVPDTIDFRDAAALMLQGLTAHYLCTSTFALKAGQFALVHAGAGGVGLLLTQLAKAREAFVITTVSTPEKQALSEEAGADDVIRYTETDFVREVKRITAGRGVDVAYDSVGKTTFAQSLDALRPRGTLVLFGASSGPVPPLDPQVLNAKGSLFLTRPKLGDYVADADELAWRARELFDAVIRRKLKLRREHVYPLEHAARAHTDLEARSTTGKLLLIPPLA